MIPPKIIHPVKVLLYKRIDTGIDDELGPTGLIEWSEPYAIYGQVKWDKFESLAPVPEGSDPVNNGHIVFYLTDWQRAGGSVADELELEDSSRLIVTEVRPMAHYQGKSFHVHVFFSRKRSR